MVAGSEKEKASHQPFLISEAIWIFERQKLLNYLSYIDFAFKPPTSKPSLQKLFPDVKRVFFGLVSGFQTFFNSWMKGDFKED